MEESSQENTKFLQHEDKKERFTKISDTFGFFFCFHVRMPSKPFAFKGQKISVVLHNFCGSKNAWIQL